MDRWPLLWVRLGLPQHLVGDRCCVALPEEDKTEQVDDRVALRPAEVAVRRFVGGVAQVEQEGRDRVGDDRTLGPKHLVPADLHAPDIKHVLELRGVLHVDLEEEDLLAGRDVVVLALLSLFAGVLLFRALAPTVGNEVDVLARFVDEPLRGLVHLYALLAQFRGAPNPRDQRDDDDGYAEEEGDHEAVGALHGVSDQGVDEHRGNQTEREPAPPRAPAPHGQGHGEGGRGHHGEHPGCVGSGLSVHARPEGYRDDEGDGGVDEHERPDRPPPLRGHPVARQVAGNDVKEPGHSRGSREPQDGYGGEVVGCTEGFAEVVVGEVGERPPAGASPLLELPGRDEQGGNEAGGDEIEAHYQGRNGQHLARVADAPFWAHGIVFRVAAYERHHAHPSLEAREPQGQPRKHEQRHPDHDQRVAVVGGQGALPVGEGLRLDEDVVEAYGHDHEVKQQVSPDYEHCYANGLLEAFEEDGAQHPEQQKGRADLPTVQEAWHERILDDVHSGVCGREGYGDDPRRRNEPQQAEHQQLAFPERQQLLEHRDRALSVRALRRDDAVHRQHPEEGQEDYKKGGDRRESPGCDRRDGGYVA